ncbi:MAG: ParB/RepB/Spo0J family partition protein [Planctomycetota bacterium]|nr:ParB/RepB/Spo0J family partition protein [Planctomycetota bacterium]
MDASASGTDAAKPRRLGRGLTSLLHVHVPVEVPAGPARREPAPGEAAARASAPIPTNPTHTAANTGSIARSGDEDAALSDLQSIAVGEVSPSPFQPRRVMDDGALARLAESIRRSGVLQPVLVRPRRGADGTRYELIAGERRWRAAQIAGLSTLPALVRDLSDEQAAEQALVENVQREDLNPMERAWALRSLSERFELSHAQLAERVGLERPTVANLIRLTELEPEIATLVSAGTLSAGHARALLAVGDRALRAVLAGRAAREEMSVRALERLIQAGRVPPREGTGRGVSGRDDARLAVLSDLQRRIGQQLGTKVVISTDRGGKRGRVTLEFYGLDHFDALMSRLGITTGG